MHQRICSPAGRAVRATDHHRHGMPAGVRIKEKSGFAMIYGVDPEAYPRLSRRASCETKKRPLKPLCHLRVVRTSAPLDNCRHCWGDVLRSFRRSLFNTAEGPFNCYMSSEWCNPYCTRASSCLLWMDTRLTFLPHVLFLRHLLIPEPRRQDLDQS